MREELTEAERILDGFAMTVRTLVAQEAEVSRVLEDGQRGAHYSESVARLLARLDDLEVVELMSAVLDARRSLERQRAPQRCG